MKEKPARKTVAVHSTRNGTHASQVQMRCRFSAVVSSQRIPNSEVLQHIPQGWERPGVEKRKMSMEIRSPPPKKNEGKIK